MHLSMPGEKANRGARYLHITNDGPSGQQQATRQLTEPVVPNKSQRANGNGAVKAPEVEFDSSFVGQTRDARV